MKKSAKERLPHTERQFSAGGVVMKIDSRGPKVLLIKDSYGHWTWPKGHIEKGETPDEAALREISEETGLGRLEIIKILGRQEYYFTRKNIKIFKTVYLFVVKADPGDKIIPQISEIEAAQWFSAEVALQKIEYEGSAEFVRKAIDIFNKKETTSEKR